MPSKVKRVLVLPDIHYPIEDRKTMKAVLAYAADHKWDEVIQLGDLMDFDVISSHNAGNLRVVSGKSIQKDYDYANKQLDRLQSAIKSAPLVILEGNHDYRVERYIDAHPETEGLLEVPIGLKFAERGVTWVTSWRDGSVHKVGNANFIHGIYTNDHHAKKHVTTFGEPIFYGHLHDFQAYSQVLQGDNKTLVGQSLGCLCDYRPYWMKGRPNRWQQGFAVFHVHPDGFFQYFPVMIFKHRFVSPEGEVYDGNKL